MKTYRKCIDKQDFKFVALHGFGEPLLHPKIFEFVKIAHDRGFRTRFSTNGKLLSRDVLDKLVDAGLDLLWVSIRPFFDEVKKILEPIYDEYAKKMTIMIYYVEYENKYKSLPNHWNATHLEPHTWSQQVDLPFKQTSIPCFNLSNKAVTVLWDGRVSNCCHDVDGKYIIGTIDDDSIEPGVVDLCKRCEFYGKEKI